MPEFKNHKEMFLYKVEATHYHFENKQFNKTQEEIAERIGRTQPYVSQRISLVEKEIQSMLRDRQKDYEEVRGEYAEMYGIDRFNEKFDADLEINDILGVGVNGIREIAEEVEKD